MLSLSAFDAFAGSVGDPKPFVITDTNKDGTVGGGDFGISIEGGSLVFKNDAVPFVSAKSSTLADHIYSAHKNKKIIMIGERHQTNASDITVDLLRLAKADGKKQMHLLNFRNWISGMQ